MAPELFRFWRDLTYNEYLGSGEILLVKKNRKSGCGIQPHD